MADEVVQQTGEFSDDPFWRAYSEAHPYLQDFIVSEPVSRLVLELEKDHKLEENIIGSIVGDFILRLIKEEELESALVENLEITPDKAAQVKRQLVDQLFSLDQLVRKYIQSPATPDLDQLIEQVQGGAKKDAPVDYEKTLAKVMPQIKPFLTPENEKRFENIISSYYGQVRTADQTKEKLMHSAKVGGAELDEQTAQLVVNVLENTDVVYKQEKGASMSGDVAQDINDKTKQILQITGSDQKMMRNMLIQSIEEKDTVSTIAALKALAGSKKLMDVLPSTPGYLEMGESLPPEQQERFEQNNVHPRFVQTFLKNVLMQELGLQKQEAAQYISQIASILQKVALSDYADLAYYDLDAQEFKFTKYQ